VNLTKICNFDLKALEPCQNIDISNVAYFQLSLIVFFTVNSHLHYNVNEHVFGQFGSFYPKLPRVHVGLNRPLPSCLLPLCQSESCAKPFI